MMRILSLLLIICIIFLSCFAGMAPKTIAPTVEKDCCKKMSGVCHAQPKKEKQADDCGQPGCAMMFSCTICGFLTEEPLKIAPVYSYQISKPVAHHITDSPTAYHSDNWKPPQTCWIAKNT